MGRDSCRLPEGGRIDRSRPLRFRFNGREYTGFQGDTLASALLANGVSLTARSFKYHRPRGIVGSGAEEPASLVEIEGDGASGNRPITVHSSSICSPGPTSAAGSGSYGSTTTRSREEALLSPS